MPPKKFGNDNPFGQESDNKLIEFDAAVYGGVKGLPESGRVVAKPISIFALRPDLRQPRRAIPASVRGEWDGEPDGLEEVIERWADYSRRAMNLFEPIPMARAVDGKWERLAVPDDPVVQAFLGLLDLAAGIAKDGLINPIHVAKGIIESGERRWLAYHLLNLYSARDFSKIPAVEKDEISVWAQAGENGARNPLNAIGMARQLALLILDMYEGDSGVQFDSFDKMLLPGEPDRKFYAQVRDGNAYPIKRGMGERVLNVTGLKSMDMVRRYRALLNIPDALWVKADEQGWSEREIRDYVDAAKPNNQTMTQVHGVTGVTPQGGQPGGAEGGARVADVQTGLYTGRVQSTSPTTPKGQTSPPTPLLKERGEVPRYDEDYDDAPVSYADDDDEFVEVESGVALLTSWGDGRSIGAVLAFMKQLARKDDALRQRITELMTVSPEDLRQWQGNTSEGWWDSVIEDTSMKLSKLMEREIIDEMLAYLKHLLETGRDIRQKHGRR